MNIQQCRNVMVILQRDPFFYRNFGPWWWHVKMELQRNGFTKSHLSTLGDFTDPSVAYLYKNMSRTELDNRAFEHQWNHTFERYNDNTTFTPDGEVYLIHDQDVE